MNAKVSRLAVGSWALYDLANTIFSMNIVSLYFSLWVVNDMGGTDSHYGLANSLSMALIFISAPILGALSDQAGRRMPFLVTATIVCVLFTALLGTGGLIASLIFFVVANYMFQAGLIFYDPLLAEVSTEENRGRVGGLGIGLGYLGSFIGVSMGLIILSSNPSAKPLVFRLTAILFLLFALPCFLFVRERRRASTIKLGGANLRDAVLQVRHTITHAQQFPGLFRFLIGRIFYTDSVNTVIVFMGIYVTNEVGFSEQQAQIVLLVAIATAIVGGLIWGIVVDQIGPKRTLNIVLLLWMVIFLGVALIALLGWPSALFWPIASLAGIALGGTWTADRPYLMRLSPPRYLGQFYGLYSMVSRFGQIVGPLLWVTIADMLGLGRPVAVLSLLLLIVISYVILQGVSDTERVWPEELQAI